MRELWSLNALGVFGAMALVDVLWVIYVRRANNGSAVHAGFASVGIMLLGGYVTIDYVKSVWYLIPAALGCYLGTWVTMKYEQKEKEKKKAAKKLKKEQRMKMEVGER